MASIFDNILADGIRKGQVPARTQKARNWYRERASRVRSNAAYPANIIADVDNKAQRPELGQLYHFRYDPKHKLTLPYYDKFPLIFMVGSADDGFYGINMHYLPPRLRARLMDALYSVTNNKRFDETTKLNISYQILKGSAKYKWFKPTFKHYLTKHVRSRFIKLESAEWDVALWLPTARFEKANRQKVYSDSRRIIAGQRPVRNNRARRGRTTTANSTRRA